MSIQHTLRFQIQWQLVFASSITVRIEGVHPDDLQPKSARHSQTQKAMRRRLCLQSALARVHYFRRPLVDWLRMQVPKTLGHSFGRLGVGGNGGRNCHGGDVDACPLETLKSAERQRSDTRLADAEGDELRIWLPHRSVSLGSNQPTRGRVWRRYWPSDPATVAPSSSAVATMASNKHSSFIMSRTRYRRLNAGDSPASHRWF